MAQSIDDIINQRKAEKAASGESGVTAEKASPAAEKSVQPKQINVSDIFPEEEVPIAERQATVHDGKPTVNIGELSRYKTELQKNAEKFVLEIDDPLYNEKVSKEAEEEKETIEEPEAEKARTELRKKEHRSQLACIFSATIFAAAFLFEVLSGSLLADSSFTANPQGYGIIMSVFAVLGILCSLNIIISGFRAIAHRPFIIESIAAFASVLIIINCFVYFTAPSAVAFAPLGAFLFSLFAFQFRRHSANKKRRADYRFLISKGIKGRVAYSEETEGNCAINIASLYKSETPPTEKFFLNSTVKSPAEKWAPWIIWVSLGLGFIAALIAIINNKGFSEAFTILTLIGCFAVSPALAFCDELPFFTLAKKLYRSGAAIIGYETIEKTAAVDRVVLSDNDVFDAGSVSLCGIKVYGDHRIDEIIIDAASALCNLDGPLSAVLFEVIDKKEALLKQVDDIYFYDEKGIKAFFGDNVVIIGTRKLLKDCFIKIPDDGIEEKLIKQGKKPIYVAVGGEIAALLSLKYEPKESTLKAIKQLVRMGVSIKINTDDPNITEKFLGDVFGGESSFRVAPSHSSEPAEGNEATIVSTNGKIAGFIKALAYSFKLHSILFILNIIALSNIVFGIAFTFLLVIGGGFAATHMTGILLLQLLWLIPIFIVNLISKGRD